MEATPTIQRLLDADALRRPVLREVIRSLQLPSGSSGLDAGCGIGLQASLLAETLGPGGHVTGIDIDPGAVAFGNERVRTDGLSDRITLREADVNRLPFADDTFDWAWSADCVGYPAGPWTPCLDELVRVVRPGGSVILLGWSSQQLLPGHPFLEARLNATCSGYLPFLRGSAPELSFLRATRWLRRVGLVEVEARTFAGDVRAPLDPRERAALLSLFEMLWGERQPEVSPEDWSAYRRLCTPESPDCILDVDEYYAFFTYSLFGGRLRTNETAHLGRPAGFGM